MVHRGPTCGQPIRLQPLRCSKCKAEYPDAFWTESQRRAHKAWQTHLVCKACRDQGFHPRNLEAFTCQCCKGNFGSKRFGRDLLSGFKKYRKRPRTALKCNRCVALESGESTPKAHKNMALVQPKSDAGEEYTKSCEHKLTEPEEVHLVQNSMQIDLGSTQRKQLGFAGRSRRQNPLKCSKCKMAYEDACWTRIQRQNHRACQTKLVCSACQVQGFHPRNLQAYTCQTCNKNLGARRFDRVLLNSFKQRPGVRLECMQCVAHDSRKKSSASTQCANPPLQCSKCMLAYEDSYWTANERYVCRTRQKALVCKTCRAQGYHPRNLTGYTCQKCQDTFGTRRFKKAMLMKFRLRPWLKRKLECTKCCAQHAKKG